ncbi:MAG: hypothetical protein AAFX76_02750 [Planctomycetota bacterium]
MAQATDQESAFAPRPATDAAGFELSGDRPVRLALAASAVAGVASVPVVLAVYGAVPMGHLLYVAMLIGLLVGSVGLVVAGLGVAALRAVRGFGRATGERADKRRARGGWRGRLAFD